MPTPPDEPPAGLVEALDCRASVTEILDGLRLMAASREDAITLMLVAALDRVHHLYDGYDEPRLRGTPEHQARVAIHNAIAAEFIDYADRRADQRR